MTTTISGMVISPDRAARWLDDYGALTAVTTIETFAPHVDEVIPVDISHSLDWIGEVAHLELDERGAMFAVATVDGLDEALADWPDPLYFSGTFIGETEPNTAGLVSVMHEARVAALSLTDAPAALGLHPLHVQPGDVRSTTGRLTWPISTTTRNPLLGRAVAELDHRGRGPIRLCERIKPPTYFGHDTYIDHRGDLVGRSLSGRMVRLPTGEVVPLEIRPGGRIISVH